MSDFEVVNGSRGNGNDIGKKVGEFVNGLDPKTKGELVHAAAENFGEIVNLAGQIVSIRKIYAESDKAVAEIDAKREVLITETENYVKKIEADTNQTISKAEIFRSMLNDFYKNNNGSLTGEEFAGIMKEIIAQIGG